MAALSLCQCHRSFHDVLPLLSRCVFVQTVEVYDVDVKPRERETDEDGSSSSVPRGCLVKNGVMM